MKLSRPNLPLAIALLISGTWTLTLLDATAKLLSQHGFHVVTISWVRYFGHTLLIAVLLGPRMGSALIRPRSPRLQLLRGVLMLCTTLLFFATLKRLPLAEATAINFCAPLIVVALSPWLLGERGTVARWMGVCGGFVGMLMVVRPGANLDTIGVMMGLCNAVILAFFHILTRKLAPLDAPMVTLFCGGLIGAVVCSAGIPFFIPAATLSGADWALLLSTGVTGSLGHYLLISAFKRAPASVLSPFIYLQIIAATLVGYWVFDQHPDGWTGVGIGIICSCGVLVALAERYRHG